MFYAPIRTTMHMRYEHSLKAFYLRSLGRHGKRGDLLHAFKNVNEVTKVRLNVEPHFI